MIIQSGPDSPWVQAGIVSWGIGTVTFYIFKNMFETLAFLIVIHLYNIIYFFKYYTGCGKAPYPGVYTRVTSFMSWITQNNN